MSVPAPPVPRATIVIVSWNVRDLLLEALSVLRGNAAHIDPAWDVVVVDNDSRDGSLEAVRASFPEVRSRSERRNRGYAAAANRGLRGRRGRHAILLNPDARAAPEALAALLDYLDAHPEAVFAGPQLLDPDGSLQNSFDNFPGLIDQWLPKSVLRAVAPGRFPSKRRPPREPTEVESLVGACLAVRGELLDRRGGLDEDYFLFLEETDWARRAAGRGGRSVFVPRATVVHGQGRSKALVRADARIEYLRSLFIYLERHRGPGTARLVRAAKTIGAVFHCLGLIVAAVLSAGGPVRLRQRVEETFRVAGWLCAGTPLGAGIPSLDPPPDYIPRRTGGHRWWVRSDRTGGPSEAALAAPEEWTSRPGVVPLKDLSRKRQWILPPGTVGSRRVLLKERLALHTAEAWKWALRGTPARRETLCASAVHRRGVDTLFPLAFGDDGGRRCHLLIEWDTERVGMDHFLRGRQAPPGRSADDPAFRHAVLRAYGAFARKVHRAGIDQDDFEPNNVLVGADEDGHPRLVLIDCERVRLRRGPLEFNRSVWLLAKMARFEEPRLTRTDRVRFLRAYAGFERAWKDVWRAVAGAQRRLREVDAGHAAAAAWKENRNIGIARTRQGTWAFHRFRPEAAEAGLRPEEVARLDELCDRPDLWKPGPAGGAAGRVFEADVDLGQGERSVCGRIVPDAGRARALWADFHAARRAGVPCVAPLAARDSQNAPVVLAGLREDETLLLDPAEPAASIPLPADGGPRLELAFALGGLLGRTHRAGWAGGPVDWRSLVVRAEKPLRLLWVLPPSRRESDAERNPDPIEAARGLLIQTVQAPPRWNSEEARAFVNGYFRGAGEPGARADQFWKNWETSSPALAQAPEASGKTFA